MPIQTISSIFVTIIAGISILAGLWRSCQLHFSERTTIDEIGEEDRLLIPPWYGRGSEASSTPVKRPRDRSSRPCNQTTIAKTVAASGEDQQFRVSPSPLGYTVISCICYHCKRDVSYEDIFCGHCGIKLPVA